MKATGIVRRIDECVIMGQSRETVDMTGFFADFVQTSEPKK